MTQSVDADTGGAPEPAGGSVRSGTRTGPRAFVHAALAVVAHVATAVLARMQKPSVCSGCQCTCQDGSYRWTPVPPPAEQACIVARVSLLRRHCADLRQRLAARQTTQAHLAEALIDEVA